MIKFSQEKVLLLHKLITEETGGDPNVRDIALLNSALESEGVEYRYELNTDEATKTTEPLKLKLIQVDGGGNGNLGDYGNNGSI